MTAEEQTITIFNVFMRKPFLSFHARFLFLLTNALNKCVLTEFDFSPREQPDEWF